MKSAAISAAFSFVMALGEFCSPASNTYSSVPPSLAAPRYRNNSTDMAGIARKKVIRIVARKGIGLSFLQTRRLVHRLISGRHTVAFFGLYVRCHGFQF